jgi:hypothetical protein
VEVCKGKESSGGGEEPQLFRHRSKRSADKVLAKKRLFDGFVDGYVIGSLTIHEG